MAWEIETVYSLDEIALLPEIIETGIEEFLWDVITDTEDPGYAQYQDNINSYTVPANIVVFSQILFDGTVSPVPTWRNLRDRYYIYVGNTHLQEVASTDIIRTVQSLVGEDLNGASKRDTWANCKVEPENLKPTWAEMKTEFASIQAQDAKDIQVAAVYKTMSENIGAQVFATFSTTDEASANAFSQSWKIKSERAAEYAGEGLLAREAIAGFSAGDALDTEQKVQSYYDEKVNQLIAFDKFRDAEILTYLTAKAVIDAS